MSEIKITRPDSGELALSGPATVRILEDGTTTSHRLGLAEIMLAPHTGGPQQHRHLEHDEGYDDSPRHRARRMNLKRQPRPDGRRRAPGRKGLAAHGRSE